MDDWLWVACWRIDIRDYLEQTAAMLAAGSEQVMAGGGFYHRFDRELVEPHFKEVYHYSYDLRENSQLGFFMGGQFEIIKNLLLNMEYQHNASAKGFGVNFVWRF